jgi:folate-binding protein YgfZ
MNASPVTLADLRTRDHDVVALRGPDARSFLQSLVSQDLDPLAAGDGARSLLLQPQGKLIAPFRVLVVSDSELLLDGDPGTGVLLHEGLSRFKIRVKVDIELLSGIATLMLRGPKSDELATRAGLALPGTSEHAHAVDPSGARVVRTSWGANPGLDIFVASEAVGALHARLVEAGAVELDDDAYETARVEAGVLVFGPDIDDRTIPQEAELEVDGVSFTKGCFVGQELVCRIDTRGHVNRFVRRLEFDDGAAAASVGSDVLAAGKSVGTVTSAAPQSPWALATIRREIEPGGTVEVDGRAARVFERRP